MTIRVRTFTSPDETYPFDFRWPVAFVGAALDSRGQQAVQVVGQFSAQTLVCEYHRESPRSLKVGGTVHTHGELVKAFDTQHDAIVLETTTLDLVEILWLLRAAKERGIRNVDLLYAEPVRYQREHPTIGDAWKRDFSLSGNRRFEGVPGYITNFADLSSADTTLVVFLGFEGSRLAQACEQNEQLAAWKKIAVMGVPAYAPGWEINSLANNAATLGNLHPLDVRYCAASSVTGALEILRGAHKADWCTVVAPFGTKPHSIAAALFLIEHCQFQQATLIWDHPENSANRSDAVRRWHVFRVGLAGS